MVTIHPLDYAMSLLIEYGLRGTCTIALAGVFLTGKRFSWIDNDVWYCHRE
jgi:hypothetical protein